MYQLVTAYHRPRRHEERWREVDLRQAPIATLAATYGQVWLYITYPPLTEPKALNWDTVFNRISAYPPQTTVEEWLTLLGNTTLPWADALPDLAPRFVRYANAWHAGYDLDPIARDGTVSAGGSLTAKQDLSLTHPKIASLDIHRHCLFTVNGLFHLADADTERVVIHQGNETLRRCNDNQIGVYSFYDVGTVRSYPITEAMIAPGSRAMPLKDGAYLTLPESIDLANKTVLLVVGGFLHTPGQGYSQVNDRVFRIHTSQLGLMERYYASYQRINLERLGLTPYPDNPGLVSTSEMREDATILAYLTLPQSFVVVVDTPTVFQELIPLERVGVPGRYVTHQPTDYPVVGAYGLMLEYHQIEQHGLYMLATPLNRRQRFDFHTRLWSEYPALDDSRLPHHPFDHAPAHLRLIGTEG